jgi:hypothetical protein
VPLTSKNKSFASKYYSSAEITAATPPTHGAVTTTQLGRPVVNNSFTCIKSRFALPKTGRSGI